MEYGVNKLHWTDLTSSSQRENQHSGQKVTSLHTPAKHEPYHRYHIHVDEAASTYDGEEVEYCWNSLEEISNCNKSQVAALFSANYN